MKSTKSLCPECSAVIDASILEENGKIILEKTCSKHGYFKDIYWSSAKQYKRFERYWHDGEGVSNPIGSNGNCPHACGLCTSHKTTTILANIDVTNRCNQACPVCFANAQASGYLYEPSLAQIRAMMQMLRNETPVPCPAVQFAGGEPTMREDIVQIVKMAHEFKFTQIQMATNGIKLAKSLTLCQQLNEAGLHTVYLQFDGVTEKPYFINRGYNALPLKLKAIENCRMGGLTSISLVPTLAKGVNDMQVGDIIRFAVTNLDTVKGINFQPISFAGRINKEERMAKRITIPDLFNLIEEQTDGAISAEDFYPVPFVVPISHFVSAEEGVHNVEFTVHPHCGTGTYVYIEDGKMIPITRFIDVEGLLEHINELALGGDKWLGKSLGKMRRIGSLISALPRYIDTAKAPKSIDVKKLFINVLKEGTGEATKEFHRHTLFIGAMHFMDLYNMDLERIKRCGVHYATPDGRIIPFCTYNTIHRVEVERKFATPLIRVRSSK
ncbi:MAG: tetraether lipid synthase Tes [Candidatus Methanoperedens sp.]|nr:radical SAM protein [Candidatus Methanoperedens sp.]MCZ7396432.1 radical SAM protein [Candidatus Methanoperedens sp.]